MPCYTRRTGLLNLASYQPDHFARPDLGPKLYCAYGNCTHPDTASTNLHLDMSDACNVMLHVSVPKDDRKRQRQLAIKLLQKAGCEQSIVDRCETEIPGALWHIFAPEDNGKIRAFLNKVSHEKGIQVEKHDDPIHDQKWFLTAELLARLKAEHGVVGYAFVQFAGDAVFIPCAAAHQVQNINSCVKAAHDFVSPEHISDCFDMMQGRFY